MKRQENPKRTPDDYDYLSSAASATEFTGLIPSLPQNDAELESYNDIWKFLPSAAPAPCADGASRRDARK